MKLIYITETKKKIVFEFGTDNTIKNKDTKIIKIDRGLNNFENIYTLQMLAIDYFNKNKGEFNLQFSPIDIDKIFRMYTSDNFSDKDDVDNYIPEIYSEVYLKYLYTKYINKDLKLLNELSIEIDETISSYDKFILHIKDNSQIHEKILYLYSQETNDKLYADLFETDTLDTFYINYKTHESPNLFTGNNIERINDIILKYNNDDHHCIYINNLAVKIDNLNTMFNDKSNLNLLYLFNKILLEESNIIITKYVNIDHIVYKVCKNLSNINRDFLNEVILDSDTEDIDKTLGLSYLYLICHVNEHIILQIKLYSNGVITVNLLYNKIEIDNYILNDELKSLIDDKYRQVVEKLKIILNKELYFNMDELIVSKYNPLCKYNYEFKVYIIKNINIDISIILKNIESDPFFTLVKKEEDLSESSKIVVESTLFPGTIVLKSTYELRSGSNYYYGIYFNTDNLVKLDELLIYVKSVYDTAKTPSIKSKPTKTVTVQETWYNKERYMFEGDDEELLEEIIDKPNFVSNIESIDKSTIDRMKEFFKDNDSEYGDTLYESLLNQVPGIVTIFEKNIEPHLIDDDIDPNLKLNIFIFLIKEFDKNKTGGTKTSNDMFLKKIDELNRGQGNNLEKLGFMKIDKKNPYTNSCQLYRPSVIKFRDFYERLKYEGRGDEIDHDDAIEIHMPLYKNCIINNRIKGLGITEKLEWDSLLISKEKIKNNFLTRDVYLESKNVIIAYVDDDYRPIYYLDKLTTEEIAANPKYPQYGADTKYDELDEKDKYSINQQFIDTYTNIGIILQDIVYLCPLLWNINEDDFGPLNIEYLFGIFKNYGFTEEIDIDLLYGILNSYEILNNISHLESGDISDLNEEIKDKQQSKKLIKLTPENRKQVVTIIKILNKHKEISKTTNYYPPYKMKTKSRNILIPCCSIRGKKNKDKNVDNPFNLLKKGNPDIVNSYISKKYNPELKLNKNNYIPKGLVDIFNNWRIKTVKKREYYYKGTIDNSLLSCILYYVQRINERINEHSRTIINSIPKLKEKYIDIILNSDEPLLKEYVNGELDYIFKMGSIRNVTTVQQNIIEYIVWNKNKYNANIDLKVYLEFFSKGLLTNDNTVKIFIIEGDEEDDSKYYNYCININENPDPDNTVILFKINNNFYPLFIKEGPSDTCIFTRKMVTLDNLNKDILDNLNELYHCGRELVNIKNNTLKNIVSLEDIEIINLIANYYNKIYGVIIKRKDNQIFLPILPTAFFEASLIIPNYRAILLYEKEAIAVKLSELQHTHENNIKNVKELNKTLSKENKLYIDDDLHSIDKILKKNMIDEELFKSSKVGDIEYSSRLNENNNDIREAAIKTLIKITEESTSKYYIETGTYENISLPITESWYLILRESLDKTKLKDVDKVEIDVNLETLIKEYNEFKINENNDYGILTMRPIRPILTKDGEIGGILLETGDIIYISSKHEHIKSYIDMPNPFTNTEINQILKNNLDKILNHSDKRVGRIAEIDDKIDSYVFFKKELISILNTDDNADMLQDIKTTILDMDSNNHEQIKTISEKLTTLCKKYITIGGPDIITEFNNDKSCHDMKEDECNYTKYCSWDKDKCNFILQRRYSFFINKLSNELVNNKIVYYELIKKYVSEMKSLYEYNKNTEILIDNYTKLGETIDQLYEIAGLNYMSTMLYYDDIPVEKEQLV